MWQPQEARAATKTGALRLKRPTPTWHVELWDELLDVCGGCSGTLPAVPQAVEQAVGRVKLATLQVCTHKQKRRTRSRCAHTKLAPTTPQEQHGMCACTHPLWLCAPWGSQAKSPHNCTQLRPGARPSSSSRSRGSSHSHRGPANTIIQEEASHHQYRTRGQPPLLFSLPGS